MPWQRRNSEFPGIHARKRHSGNRQNPSAWEDAALNHIRRLPPLRTPRLWATRDSHVPASRYRVISPLAPRQENLRPGGPLCSLNLPVAF